MKTYIYLILLIFLSSCSIFKNEINKEENFWNESISQEKLNDIKVLLSPEVKEDINKNKENFENSVLTQEEIEIIESTTDWEIDELIDLLFKDLE